jgi:tRNA threonylcarbamoyladenosine biosynthesis protein TsaB
MGFRLALDLPIVEVPTLEALAWNLRGERRPLCSMLKARTGELYWALFQWLPHGELRRLCDDRVGSWQAWVDSLTGPTVLVGEGWRLNRGELRKAGAERAGWMLEAPDDAMAASAVSVGLLARVKWAKGEVAKAGAAPHYVQRAEAEVKWAARTRANAER